jgi:hypothetical protein
MTVSPLLLFILCVAIILQSHQSYEFPYTSMIQQQFVKQFQDTCSKYPFVNRFISKLEDPGDRYLMFVFDEQGLNNGGLGDRFAGLLSAVAMALRFNRTLLIRDSRGFSKYFRPYHPEDIHNNTPKYLWDDYLQWTNYDVSLANHDATEYDLYFCINNNYMRSSACSMENGDVPQPIILLRSNRVYLCRYDRNPETAAFQEMKALLGENATTTNLYEASGCMLRLALWPTQQLWKDTDKSYFEDIYSKILTGDHVFNYNSRRRTLLRSSGDEIVHSPRPRKSKRLKGRRSLKFDLVDSVTPFEDNVFYPPSPFVPVFHQIGIHFRCGDRSYSGAHSEWDCIYDPAHPSNNDMLTLGNPFLLGSCGKEIVHNYTLKLMKSHSPIATGKIHLYNKFIFCFHFVFNIFLFLFYFFLFFSLHFYRKRSSV